MGFAYFLTSAQAVMETVLVALPGYFFARRNVLDQKVVHAISTVNLKILTPCLLFTKIVQNANLEMVLELWIEPLTYLLYTMVGLTFAWGMARACRLEYYYRRLIEVSVMFNNCNTLPYALIYSIATSPGSKFLLRDETDTPEELALRGITYAVIFGLVNNIMRWSVGMIWLQPPKQVINDEEDEDEVASVENVSDALIYHQDNNNNGCRHHQGNHQNQITSGSTGYGAILRSTGNGGGEPDNNDHRSPLLHSFRNGNNDRRLSVHSVRRSSRRAYRVFKRILKPLESTITLLLSPPIFSLLLGIFVISVPSLRWLVINKRSPIKSLWAAMVMIGDSAIPITIMALGAQLGIPVESSDDEVEETHNEVAFAARHGSINNQYSGGYYDNVEGNNNLAQEQQHSYHRQQPRGGQPNVENMTSASYDVQTLDDASDIRSSETFSNSNFRYSRNMEEQYQSQIHHHQNSYHHQDSVSINSSPHTMVTARMPKLIICKRDRLIGTIIVMLGRFLVVPLFSIVFFSLLSRLAPSVFQQFVNDPILLLVLFILGSCPPAVNLIMITQSIGLLEDESAEILMWAYLSAIAIMSIEMTGFLWLVRHLTGQ
ncbi:hypothetical protein H4219_002836 [Mycoemilia scoparia]|uniref:Uncharacterized protein n=1 Tax=Mycoemilia scoparia TaxID=417184 RepID=A0A9W7ZWF8_9FUNG|nr:hypothetical protein H4219_002836 [Mycoemilia scoparia]